MIRLLESDNNRKGDLFARLMGDVFLSLGYDDCRFNIHKSGREVDIQADHRLERRRAVAECKALTDPVGGDDLNKFAGVLQAEEITNRPLDTVGYFISLSGFRETAIQQELDLGEQRFTQMGPTHIQETLILGRILVSPELAAQQAGRCVPRRGDLVVAPKDSWILLGHQLGWIWAVALTRGGDQEAVVLVHADGEVLSREPAERVIVSDTEVGGELAELELITLDPAEPSEDEMLERYLAHVAAEHGAISLEGLPADEQVGSRLLPLERIYVPLRLQPLSGPRSSAAEVDAEAVEAALDDDQADESDEVGIGEVLAPGRKLAVVAAPGAGKTTLLKRLAVAYANPERRNQPDESLPDADWLPLVVRCRQLGALVGEPVRDILSSIPSRAEMPDLEAPFARLLDRHLRSGEVLILVDGLDEIPDESDRVSFVGQLRTFVATYPAVSLVVTSRETGYRAVAGGLAPVCDTYRVADLWDEDILQLTLAWHREVVGRGTEIESKARLLADQIVASDRIARLARNPLLLTTLLLVQRWVGEVPRRRSVLYEKAIEVLLMTWNVEAHHPIDVEEAIPQLAFVAFSLLQDGRKLVSGKTLVELLQQSRSEMPEILTYARTSPNDFLARVEERSSLLIQSGHAIEDGVLRPVYEFRHLTFQEYLAAVAAAEGYYPGHTRKESFADVLDPYLDDASWREVLPLAAVRAGRDGDLLIRKLIRRCHIDMGRYRDGAYGAGRALLECVLDEALMEPDLAKSAVLTSVEAISGQDFPAATMAKSRYGELARVALQERYMAFGAPAVPFGSALGSLVVFELTGSEDEFAWSPAATDGLLALLSSDDQMTMACGALGSMVFGFTQFARIPLRRTKARTLPIDDAQTLIAPLHRLLNERSLPVQHAACWALAWLFSGLPRHQRHEREIFTRLLGIWQDAKRAELRRQAAWALGQMRLMKPGKVGLDSSNVELITFLNRELFGSHSPADEAGRRMRRRAAIIAAYYVNGPWPPETLLSMFQAVLDRPPRAARGPQSRLDAEVIRAFKAEINRKT